MTASSLFKKQTRSKHGDCQKGTLISFDNTELFQTPQALTAPQPQLDKYICIDHHLPAVWSLQKGACLKIHTVCIVILVFLSAVSVVFFNFGSLLLGGM